jgi:hypothetical protein
MTVYRDLGYHFPVYRDHATKTNETQYWKRLYFGVAQIDDAFEHFGYAHVDDGGVAATNDDDMLLVAPSAMELRNAFIVSEDGHSGADTNYKTIKLVNLESGSGSDEMAGQDYESGVDLTQDDAETIPVNGTQANRQVAVQDVVQVQLGHASSGQAFGPAHVFAEFEAFVDITNGISKEELVMKAPHRMLILGAYIIAHEGNITGADTNTASVNVVNKGQAGTGTTEVASIDFTNGQDASQHVPKAMTLNTTVSNRVVERGDVVVAQLVKEGTGLQLNEVSVVLLGKAVELS